MATDGTRGSMDDRTLDYSRRAEHPNRMRPMTEWLLFVLMLGGPLVLGCVAGPWDEILRCIGLGVGFGAGYAVVRRGSHKGLAAVLMLVYGVLIILWAVGGIVSMLR